MENKILTAEEFWRQKAANLRLDKKELKSDFPNWFEEEVMIEFAKLHVEAIKKELFTEEDVANSKRNGIEYACNILEGLLETGVNPKYNLSDLLRLKTNLIDKSQVRENENIQPTWDDVMNSYRETLKTWNSNAFGYLTLENYLKSNFEPPKRIKKIN